MKSAKKPPASRYRPTTKQKNWLRGFQWLLPGLLVKRWLLVSIIGIFLIVLGIAISARLTPILFISRLIGTTIDTLVAILPRNFSGPIALAIGLGLLWLGQKRALGSITQVLIPDQNKELLELLVSHRKLNRGPKIITVGGGTGMTNL